MKILIFGRGVIGTLYGWALEKAGQSVEFRFAIEVLRCPNQTQGLAGRRELGHSHARRPSRRSRLRAHPAKRRLFKTTLGHNGAPRA
jgi:ketopantoate reductase